MENTEKTRNPDGTFPEGNTFGFTKDNPRPGPGRPPKDAWLRELEADLEAHPDKKRRMAEEVYRIATEGDDDKVRLAALDKIQDRIGGPVVRKVEAEHNIVEHSIELIDRRRKGDPTTGSP